MFNQREAISEARLVVIEKLAAYRADAIDERLKELKATIERWQGAVRAAIVAEQRGRQ